MKAAKRMLALLCAVLTMAACTPRRITQPDPTPAPTEERHLRQGIQAVLLAGLEQTETAPGSFRNDSRADLILLMVVDETGRKTSALQLSPDTLVSFAEPGTQTTADMPLGQVFSYGSGGSDSCVSLEQSVSRLLGGVPIAHYMVFTGDALVTVNDLVGGVDAEIHDIFPGDYPELTVGSTVHLMGDNAAAYFGYRAPADTDGSAHMARQQQYVTGLLSPLAAQLQQEDFLTRLTMALGDGLQTDLVLSQMVQLLELIEICRPGDTVVTLPGETVISGGETRFRADDAATKRLVDSLFY